MKNTPKPKPVYNDSAKGMYVTPGTAVNAKPSDPDYDQKVTTQIRYEMGLK